MSKKTLPELQDALGTLNRERAVDKHEWGKLGPVELRQVAVKRLKGKNVEVPINASIASLIEMLVEHLYQPKFDRVYAAIAKLTEAVEVAEVEAEVQAVEVAEVEAEVQAVEVAEVEAEVQAVEVAEVAEVVVEVAEVEVEVAEVEAEVIDIDAALDETPKEPELRTDVFAIGAITGATFVDVGGDIPELPKVETPVKPKKAAKTPAEPKAVKPKKAAAGIPDGYRARWDDDKRQYALERRGMDGVWVILGKSKRGWWVEKLTSAQPWLAKAAKDDAAAGIQVLPTDAPMPMPTTIETTEVVA